MCVTSLGKEANVGHFPFMIHSTSKICVTQKITFQYNLGNFDLCLLQRQICHLRIFFIHLPNADKISMIMSPHDRSVYKSNLCEADDDTYGNVGLANQFV